MTARHNDDENLNQNLRLAPNGVEWWHPAARSNGRVIGREKRIAAFLWFQVPEGSQFTMKTIRDGLGEGADADDSEQLNRRLRELRKDKWIIESYKDDRALPGDAYRLTKKGAKIWLGGPRSRSAISQKLRRLVFERDGSRCVVCGVGNGEPYPGESGSKAKLTVGHRIPDERLGKPTLDNLQTECARCNEPLRHDLRNPESLDEVLSEVRNLKKDALRELYNWMRAGSRSRSQLDRVYDRARMLSQSEREKLIERLKQMLGTQSH